RADEKGAPRRRSLEPRQGEDHRDPQHAAELKGRPDLPLDDTVARRIVAASWGRIGNPASTVSNPNWSSSRVTVALPPASSPAMASARRFVEPAGRPSVVSCAAGYASGTPTCSSTDHAKRVPDRGRVEWSAGESRVADLGAAACASGWEGVSRRARAYSRG